MTSANVPDAESRIQERVERQELVNRRTGPEYWVVLDEAVVRRPFGGRQVMGDQIRKLVEMSARPNISIQIISTADRTGS